VYLEFIFKVELILQCVLKLLAIAILLNLTHSTSYVVKAAKFENYLCTPVSWSWEDWGGNVSKQLAQGCCPIDVNAGPVGLLATELH